MSLPSPLPNFLGIGAPRAGTTWLHDLLDSHPDVLMPSRRKELHFFDTHYGRGLSWYARSYHVRRGESIPVRIGEITPHYMYRDECLSRIQSLGTINRFIVCLRNPVDLLWSSYQHLSAIHGFRGSLSEFIEAFPHVAGYGFYANALFPWIEQFDRDQFFFVRFDSLTDQPHKLRAAIASFLEIDPNLFPVDAGLVRVNRTPSPRFPQIYSLAKRSVVYLNRTDHAWVVRLAKRLPVTQVLVARTSEDPPELSDSERQTIAQLYFADLQNLEKLTGFDVQPWLSRTRADIKAPR